MLLKYAFFFWFGGSTYCALEVLWRGYSHWTMILLAGLLFVVIGILNEVWEWETSFLLQVLTASIIATVAEFFTGCIVNIALRWNVWDYSDLPGNILGQICPQFFLLWIFISALAIVLDDLLRWKFFDEEKPRYKL